MLAEWNKKIKVSLIAKGIKPQAVSKRSGADGRRRVCQRWETALKWEEWQFSCMTGLLPWALERPRKCCKNRNHISAADLLPQITSPPFVPPLKIPFPFLCFSLAIFNLWSWARFRSSPWSLFQIFAGVSLTSAYSSAFFFTFFYFVNLA